MGSKGNRRHLKTLNIPQYIHVPKKSNLFFPKPHPGPHSLQNSMPLGYILRDVLKITDTMKETKAILNKRKVMIDGKIRTEEHFAVGLMDVIEIPELNKAYRVLPSKKSGLTLSEITKAEAKFKLCRIENITTVKKGHVQLNLHDGRNILIPVKDPKKKLDIPYKTMGTLKISIPDQKILEYYPNEISNQAIVMAGKNVGFSGKVSNLIKRFGINASIAIIDAGEGNLINTAYEYSFIIGKDKPSIDLPNE